jgi:predicted lipoprotein
VSKIETPIIVSLAAATLVACGAGPAPTESGRSTQDFGPVLEATVTGVIIPTYRSLFEEADALLADVRSLQTEDDLARVRTRWLATRRHWEQSEAFLFGPVADLGLDPALDSWPVDRVQLDQVLASQLDLGAGTISANLGGGLKGFHTIEYLLFGIGGSQTAAALVASPREMAYLDATAEALRDDTQTLYLAWAPEGDGFGASFASSGKPGGRYFSSADALQQLINGCADISDEVANGKLADPFKEKNPELVESQFAHSSLSDFADNLRSVDNIYGAAGQTHSISALVAEKDPALDLRVRTTIAEAIAAIGAISPTNNPTFAQAIQDPSRAPLIEAAQAAVRKVGDLMLGQVRSACLGQ